MPLWLDLLRTPMAAPETRVLRRLRYLWQGLCLSSAAVIGLFGPLYRAIGRAGAVAAAILLLATAICTIIYVVRKHRADSAFLDTLGGAE